MHEIYIDPHLPLNKEFDIYNYRRAQDHALVSTYSVNNLRETSPHLCGHRDILQVMTEHIPVRVHQLRQLSLPESVYLLSESIRGFDDCHSKVGHFLITDQMIGLNKNGHVRVWLN